MINIFPGIFSRILGFYRVPPTAGREVNLTQDIRRLAEPKLKKTFFISPGMVHIQCIYLTLKAPITTAADDKF